jgi:transcriptional regulator with XRE-family HTH domain
MLPGELVYREFGKRLASERSRKGLTQAQLADLVGLSRASITNIERGRQRVQLHLVYSFANALQTPAGALLPRGSRTKSRVAAVTSETGELSNYLEQARNLLARIR